MCMLKLTGYILVRPAAALPVGVDLLEACGAGLGPAG